jgi:hypothetical protein
MNNEFNGYCSRHYTLTDLLATQQEHLNNLFNNAPPYTGQTNLAEIDALIKCYRKIQRAQDRIDNTRASLRETERIILMVMQYFGIPPRTVLIGEVIEQLQFEIWADEGDTVYTKKIRDLVPPTDEANIIRIKLQTSRNSVTDDDD